ncbi:MAG TPA: OPT family oligopeptide transporter [Kofleriaceae bacterium]|jgi:uncharacterized oligopeptide transporter (OPT) family protein
MSPLVSHEEPDLDLPEATATKVGSDLTAATSAPDPELRGDITWQVLVAGLFVAVLMGISYPYMVLKLGFGPNVSVVAAFFGFLFLKLFDIIFGQRAYNRWQNNLAEAAGTSAAQTAFMCVLLGAFDILRYNTGGKFGIVLEPWQSFLWLTTACTLGVLLAVPLRRHFIVDEKLPYVDGLSTAETITVMDPPHDASEEVKTNATRAFKAVMIGVVVSAVLMALRSDAKLPTSFMPEGWEPENWVLLHSWAFRDGAIVMTGVYLTHLAVGVQYSVLSIGSGMLVGLRVNISMVSGAFLAWVVAPYFLTKYQVPIGVKKVIEHGEEVRRAVVTDTPTRTNVLFWVMWPATGMLVAGGLTALALRWRILVQTFQSLRNAKIGSTELPLRVVIAGVVASAVALCIVQAVVLDMPVWMTIIAIVLSLPLMLVGLRVLGETNWGPISALSNMMQGVFAAIAPGHVVANMVASGTTGTIATSSEAIMQDYKCGEVIHTKPRSLTIMQLLAVPVGAACVSWMYPLLVKKYGITGDNAQLTSAISNKWSGFAQILKEGTKALQPSALYALAVFSVLGVIFTILENNKKVKKWIPSPTGIGIGILVPFSVVFTMFLGGIVGWLWETKSKKTADKYMVPLASGLIAGEALVAVIAAVISFRAG